MKALYLIFIYLFLINICYTQNNYIFEKDIQVNEKQKKLYKMVVDWASQQKFLSNVESVDDKNIVAKGYFIFNNTVEYKESETISRTYQKQTNGKIVFKISFEVKDNSILVICSDFKHVPNMKGDGIQFGYITKNSSPPDYLSMDYGEEYCQDVWQNLKSQVKEESEILISELPGYLISAR